MSYVPKDSGAVKNSESLGKEKGVKGGPKQKKPKDY